MMLFDSIMTNEQFDTMLDCMFSQVPNYTYSNISLGQYKIEYCGGGDPRSINDVSMNHFSFKQYRKLRKQIRRLIRQKHNADYLERLHIDFINSELRKRGFNERLKKEIL